MAQNQAIVIRSAGKAEVVDVPVPKLPRDDYMIVKVTAVAVNPTDWKHVGMAGLDGCLVGCDYAGVVEEVGVGVSKNFKRGDRVCGPANGSNALRKVDGTFAKYIVVKGDLQIHTPENLSDEQAATLGVAVSTVGQGLYQKLQLPLPTAPVESPFPILIYGGSTAMGVSGIQYAKLAGLTVVATASPHNFDYVRSLGADAVFDYHSPSVADDVKAFTKGELEVAWDCHSMDDSAIICAKAMGDKGGRISTLVPVAVDKVKEVNPNIEVMLSVYYSVFGEGYQLGPHKVEPEPQDLEFGKRFWELSRDLLASGKVKPIRTEVNRGGSGLEGVLAGFQLLKEGKVSAAKLVYTL